MNYGHAVDLVHSDAGLSVSLRDTRPPLHAHPYTNRRSAVEKADKAER